MPIFTENKKIIVVVNSIFIKCALGLCLSLLPPLSLADLTDLAGLFNTELEERSAQANQTTYNQLKAGGCTDTQRGPSAVCAGNTFTAWDIVREVVHTANEVSNNGPTLFSLGLDLQGLGFTLRWTAGEEFSTQGDMSDSFIGSQLSGLASRISALRHGGSRFALNEVYDEGVLVATATLKGERPSGGSAGDADSGEASGWSPWGSFLNASYGYGDRAPTEREDAFDFEGMTVNGGVDYRFSNRHVLGVMLGYQQETLQFDSALSIVDGGVDMTAMSLQPFYLYQSERWYFTSSIGYQQMAFTMDRSIRYPSLNPNVGSTDTVTISDADAGSVSSSSTVGMSFFITPTLTLEPYFSLDYRHITVNSYTEEDINGTGFNLVVEEQDLPSLETAYGLKLQAVWQPSFAVIIPYIDTQFRIQHEDEARDINSYYFNATDGLTDIEQASFSLPTDAPDAVYQIIVIGLSSVIRGASQSDLSSQASGGIQVFINYRHFLNLEHYNQAQFSGGLRYEF
ncbi:MAG: autotransporter outer membrane beta-barrel domain-containing protein [Pseudomonadales bacterium]|nr:autotransporter outer membrane beta-barrel domain-containing protein [Pseudomonadales bacterium]